METSTLGSSSKPLKVKPTFKLVTSKYLKFGDRQTTSGNSNPRNKQNPGVTPSLLITVSSRALQHLRGGGGRGGPRSYSASWELESSALLPLAVAAHSHPPDFTPQPRQKSQLSFAKLCHLEKLPRSSQAWHSPAFHRVLAQSCRGGSLHARAAIAGT